MEFLTIVALIAVGYLLYRSVVVKRLPNKHEQPATRSSAVTTEDTSQADSNEAQPNGQAAKQQPKPFASDATPGHSATAGSSPEPAAVKPKAEPASTSTADVDAADESEQAVQQAMDSAAEKAHLETAREATQADVQQQVEGALATHTEPKVPADVEVQAAALQETNEPVARHRLYQQIVESAYKSRADSDARTALRFYAQKHLAEFDSIKGPLKKQNGGKLPQVATFKHYASVLTEDGQYEDAIEVCQKAQALGLKDGTKGGYKGREERIRAKQQAAG